MTSSLLLSITFGIYFAVAVGYLISLVFSNRKLGRFTNLVAWLGVAIQTAAIIMRWVESYQLGYGHAPMTNMYESLIFFAWAIMLSYLILEIFHPRSGLGAAVAPFAVLAMAYASFYTEAQIQPLIPALKSNWLIAHVITCFLGYAAFAVACGTAIFYFVRRNRQAETEMPVRLLEELMYRTSLIGFLLLTAGIATGAVWADQAWGTWWSWDPKETWSLVTWFVYAILLHGRLVRGWGVNKVAWMSVLGFAAVIFTYFGVNYLLSGLHSYA